MKPKTRHELRCECPRNPLLAFYGIASDNRPYFHVKTQRSNRIMCNVVFRGDAEFQCPSCGIWVRIRVRAPGSMDLDTSFEQPAESIGA